jgi:hypothetical protein
MHVTHTVPALGGLARPSGAGLIFRGHLWLQPFPDIVEPKGRVIGNETSPSNTLPVSKSRVTESLSDNPLGR